MTDMLDGDAQFYIINAGTDQEERFRRVTGPLGRWDKDGLLPWAGGLAAKGAFDILPALVNSILVPECGRSYHPECDDHDWRVKCAQCRCRECTPCLTRYLRDRHVAESRRRTDEGTRVHVIVGHWASTGVWLAPDEDIVPYVDSAKRFFEEYGIQPEDFELFEARIINRKHGYAGTLDTAIWFTRGRSKAMDDILDRLTQDGQPRVQRALILVDYKSREKPDRAIFLDMPLQLAAYRNGEVLRLKDGTEVPMVTVHAAAIVQIRPEETSLELVLAEQPEFDTFLKLLAADGWALERGKKAIGARTWSYAPSVAKLRAADQRRAKAAAKRTQPMPEETLGGGVKLGVTTSGAVVFSQPITSPEPLIEATIEAPPDDSPAARGARAAAAARGSYARNGHILESLRDSHAPKSAAIRTQSDEPPF